MLAASIKEKIRGGGVSIGTWMSLPHVTTAEILAGAGYDWVCIDAEHTAVGASEINQLLIAISGQGVAPLVRISWVDPIQAKVAMDSGAAGVIFPMVNTRAEAELAVRSVKYPPMGTRGMGLARAHRYGPGFAEYIERANRDALVIVQIEHVDAVANIDEILSVEGVDGTFIGPYDLSSSMGIPGELDHPDMRVAQDRVLKATLDRGMIAGMHLVHPATVGALLPDAIARGYRFIALGADILFLGETCRALHETARGIIAETDGG